MTTLEALQVIRDDPRAVWEIGKTALEIAFAAFLLGFLVGWAFKWSIG